MKPIIKYRGGKTKEIPQFIEYIPSSFGRYVEPFFGGGAVYFFLEPERAIINDINGHLMNFYAQLRNEYPLLRQQLDELQGIYEQNQKAYTIAKAKAPTERVPNRNEPLYYQMRERFNHPDAVYLDGAVYYFINKTAYSGMIRYNKDGEFNVPFGRYPHFNAGLVTQRHSDLLQGAELLSVDYSEVFRLLRTDDFVFLDPPYDCIFNDYGNTTQEKGFDETEHRRLASDFRNLPCKALMIIGKTPLTEELYGKYVVVEYHKNYAVNIRNRFKSEKIHLIVRNF